MTSSLAWLIPIAPYLAIALFAACLVCGSAIAASGVFGRPRARAPVCAACGHGIAQTATGADAPCAECGCDLSGPSSIRYFEVRRAPRRIAAGVAVAASSMLVLLAVHFVVMLATAAPGIGANTPAAELAAIVASPAAAPDGPNAEFARRAVEEAARRRTAGLLDAEARLVIARAILARPSARPEAFVSAEQDAFVSAARDDGLISDAELIAYLQSRVGEPTIDLPARIRVPARRFMSIAATQATYLAVDRRLKEAVFATAAGETPIPMVDHEDRPLTTVLAGTHAFLRFPETLASAPPSNGELILTIEESFSLPSAMAAGLAGPTLAVAERRVRRPLMCVAMDAPTWIGMASPQDRREEVRWACVVQAVAIDDDALGQSRGVRADFTLLPVEGLALAFDIVVRVGDEEVLVGRRVTHRMGGATRSTQGWVGVWAGAPTLPNSATPLPAGVTVLFRPNPGLAEDFPGVTDIWGETITIEGVPLRSLGQPSAGSAKDVSP